VTKWSSNFIKALMAVGAV